MPGEGCIAASLAAASSGRGRRQRLRAAAMTLCERARAGDAESGGDSASSGDAGGRGPRVTARPVEMDERPEAVKRLLRMARILRMG